jgi:phenylpropionate dioxygenase-like ring-hydroxylating dioxygenase large terminal subunit
MRRGARTRSSTATRLRRHFSPNGLSSATREGGGALEPHCAHRGTSLEWGRVEEEGLRCCYHGWLYDTQGQCIDIACETAAFCKKMNIWQEAYPVMEYGGLIFVYMGPPGTEPLFPMYDIIDTRCRDDVELRGTRVWGEYSAGYVKDCNWLQHFENVVDPYHLLVLHKMISGEQFVGAMMQGPPSSASKRSRWGCAIASSTTCRTAYRRRSPCRPGAGQISRSCRPGRRAAG